MGGDPAILVEGLLDDWDLVHSKGLPEGSEVP